jgi:hypothetical protein
MATTFYMSPITAMIQFFTNVGIVNAGGFVNVYQAGTVNTPVTTYTDSTGITANANPIPMSAAGRLQTAGGAPAACWVPAGTPHKMVMTDAAGNQLIAIDNLQGMNDPTALLALLSSSAAGSGADLVANSVKSYFNFGSLRASAQPAPISGQTVAAIVSGQSTQSDGFGGSFMWNGTSTATDDNYNVIRLSTTGGAGRYVRVGEPYLPNWNNQNPASQGGAPTISLFTSTLQGITGQANQISGSYYLLGQPAQVIGGQLVGGQVAVFALQGGGTYLGTSTATSMTLALPINTVNVAQTLPFILEDNGTVALGQAVVQNGTMTFGKTLGTGAGFTGTGTKGIPVPQTFTVQVF